jgi:hypothetical protein
MPGEGSLRAADLGHQGPGRCPTCPGGRPHPHLNLRPPNRRPHHPLGGLRRWPGADRTGRRCLHRQVRQRVPRPRRELSTGRSSSPPNSPSSTSATTPAESSAPPVPSAPARTSNTSACAPGPTCSDSATLLHQVPPLLHHPRRPPRRPCRMAPRTGHGSGRDRPGHDPRPRPLGLRRNRFLRRRSLARRNPHPHPRNGRRTHPCMTTNC